MTIQLKAAFLFAAIIVALGIWSLPLFVHASGFATCTCQNVDSTKPLFCPTVDCMDTTNGHVTAGKCLLGPGPKGCKGLTGDGKGVDAGLGALGKILEGLIGKLMSPPPSSPSSGGGAPPSPTAGATGCANGQYFQTSDITALSNPCAQYAPQPSPLSFGTSTGTSTCDTLSQLLGTCGSAPSCPSTATTCEGGFTAVSQSGTDGNGCQLPDQCVLSTNTNQNGNNNTVSQVVNATGTTKASLPAVSSPSLLAPGLQNGVGGDILFSGNGATIFGNSLNAGNNTGVAGFFGSDTFGGAQPQGLAAQLCQSRPWATGFLSSVLPTAFFDGLCTARGYQVGAPPPAARPAPVVELRQTPPAKKTAATTTTTTTATTAPAIPPRVQIWAVPASVPLGTRTSIFWNTQGVAKCTETSPDGSFNQSSLSGGSATVPLTGATTFTISCLDTGGNPITGYVTVNLSI